MCACSHLRNSPGVSLVGRCSNWVKYVIGYCFPANRILNIYKASIMRSVTQIKKNTAIKELHLSLVPKWSSTSAILDSDKDDSESAMGRIMGNSSASCESKVNVSDSSYLDTTSLKEAKVDLNGAELLTLNDSKSNKPDKTACDNTSAVTSSHLNDTEKSMLDSIDKGMIMSENCVGNMDETETTFSADKMENGKSSLDNATTGNEQQNSDTVQKTMKPKVKIKYFFERGDSLKEELQNEKELKNPVKETMYSIKRGEKRAHEPEVMFKL